MIRRLTLTRMEPHVTALVLSTLACVPTSALAWTAQPLGYSDNGVTGGSPTGYVLYDSPAADIQAQLQYELSYWGNDFTLANLELDWWNGTYYNEGIWYGTAYYPGDPGVPHTFITFGICANNGGRGSDGMCHYADPPSCDAGQVSDAAGQCIAKAPSLTVGRTNYCPWGGPVNPGTGNVYRTETDYVSNGSDPLAFERYYNSSATGRQTHVMGIGTQWRHTYMRSIHDASTTTATAAGVHRPDGRILYFTNNGDQWVPNADVTSKLQKDSVSGGWTYIATNDDVEQYDANGRLQSITDARGDVRTLTYDSRERLSRVEDSFGNSIAFAYDTYNRIQSITDRATRAWTYHYDSYNNIASVDYPDGTTRQYLYNEQNYTSQTSLPHALTGIIDERGVRYATFEYYADGRVKDSYHAGNAGRVDITYDDVKNTRTVTDSRGNSTTYTTQTQLGTVLPNQVTGPSCGCGGP